MELLFRSQHTLETRKHMTYMSCKKCCVKPLLTQVDKTRQEKPTHKKNAVALGYGVCLEGQSDPANEASQPRRQVADHFRRVLGSR